MRNRKQLYVLLAVAGWITVAVVVAYNNNPYDRLDVRYSPPFEAAFIFSLPAVLFGGILFWWFGKQPEKTRTQTEPESEFYTPDEKLFQLHRRLIEAHWKEISSQRSDSETHEPVPLLSPEAGSGAQELETFSPKSRSGGR